MLQRGRHMVPSFLWVALGSALGGMARYGVSGMVARGIGEIFPWGTLTVNVSGGFVIGILAALTISKGAHADGAFIREFLMTGICGGYTTFSSFSLQTLNLARDREWGRAALNIIASLLLCLLAVWAGIAAGAFVFGG